MIQFSYAGESLLTLRIPPPHEPPRTSLTLLSGAPTASW